MKMIPSLLFTSVVALALGGPAARADSAAQTESKPAVADSGAQESTAAGVATADPADQLYEALQKRYELLEEQMEKIRETKDPAERQKLLLEHWQTLHRDVGSSGGYGMGPGMMRGGAMGPAAGGGYGMRGYGMAPGMRMGPQMQMPSLSAEQQARIASIRDETRKKNWQLMGSIMDEQSRLRELSETPQPDSAAISEVHAKISSLQRQMYDNAVEAHKRMAEVLTPEQTEFLQRMQQGW